LFGGTFINRFGSFVAVFIVLYLRKLGYSAGDIGLTVAAAGAGSMGATLVGGQVADRLGRKNAIALSMFLSATFAVALYEVRTLGLIILFAALFGLASEMYRPASSALIADCVPEANRVAAFAAYRLAINAGFAMGPAVAGLLAESSFAYVFYGEALTSAAYGLIALFWLPEGTRVRRHEEGRGEFIRTLSRDRVFAVFWLATLAIHLVYFQSLSTLPLAVKEAGLSSAAYGTLMSLNGLVIILLEMPVVSITQRHPAPWMMGLGALLTGLGFSLTALAFNYPLFALTVFIWSLGEIVHGPVSAAYVTTLSPERLRGRYQGAWGLSFGVAMVLAPVIGTRLFEVSPALPWIACAGLGAAGALLFAFGPRRTVKPPPAQPPMVEAAGAPES
jgi:MFS family permease